jgi:preprotein translocase subunit SecF
MLRIFKDTKIDFVGYQKWAISFSILLTILTFVSIGYHKVVDKRLFNWSIEFVGGTNVQLKFDNPVEKDLPIIRETINKIGYSGSEIKLINDPLGHESNKELMIVVRKQMTVSEIGNELVKNASTALPDGGWTFEPVGDTAVKLKAGKSIAEGFQKFHDVLIGFGYTEQEIMPVNNDPNSGIVINIKNHTEIGKEIRNALSKALPQNPFKLLSIESVGPKIGGELQRDAIIAVLLSLIGILIYVWFRFQASFGVAAVIPLFHDIIITCGVFSVLDREFSLSFIAALLTIMGYSLNDNVVIFDRIRENLKIGLKGKNFNDLVNHSINQTLSRTIITSGITFIVVTILWLFGSESIKDFALAMIIGVVFGTYSTIYIATPILLWWHKRWPIVR